jgi:predicted dehydrogenase
LPNILSGFQSGSHSANPQLMRVSPPVDAHRPLHKGEVGRPLRVVIVGAGLMGKWHSFYARKLGASIVGVVDKNVSRAQALAGRSGPAKAFPELEQCLVRCNPDVAQICTPVFSHFELARLALEANAHVMIEKPAARTADETETLLHLARRRQRLFTPVHQFPFQDGFQRLRHAIAGLGEPVRVKYEAFTAGGSGQSGENRRRILFDILPHPLSLGTALFGSSFLNTLELTGPQSCDELDLWGTGRGAGFHICLSHRARPTRNSLTYIGTQGTAHVNLYHGFSVFEKGGTASRGQKILQPLDFGSRLVLRSAINLGDRLRKSVWAYPGLPELERAFYHAVRTGGAAPIAEDEVIGIARTIDRLQET